MTELEKQLSERVKELEELIEGLRESNEKKWKTYERRMSDNATIICNMNKKLEEKEKELQEGKEKWKYFETRFVKTTYKHDESEKLAYIIFPEGEETQFVDLESLIDKGLENAKKRGEIK